MARPNRHLNSERIYSPEGLFEERVHARELDGMIARGDVAPMYERGRQIGWQRTAAASDSNTTPAALTLSDTLANVGLSRQLYGDVTENRIYLAAKKIEANGHRPSWTYRGKSLGYGLAHA